MKKILCIELSYDWILSRVDDVKYPIEVLKERLLKGGKYEVLNESYLHLTLEIDEADVEKARGKVRSIISQKYGKEGVAALSFSILEQGATARGDLKDVCADCAYQVESEDRQCEDDDLEFFGAISERPTLEETLKSIDSLVGAKEYKAFAKELVNLAPHIIRKGAQRVFLSQSYLFSIGDGCGLSTYLATFADLVHALGLARTTRCVDERRLELGNKPKEDLGEIYGELAYDGDHVKVLCIDLGKWIDRTNTEEFKQLLKAMQKQSERFIYVFKVPFVEKDVLGRIATSLNDLMSVKTLAFPPFDNDEVKAIAVRNLAQYSLKMSPKAWQYFMQRIAEEKGDGKFYGLNTIDKVVNELVYKKQISVANGAKSEDLIGSNDAKKICCVKEDKGEGMSQLARLVGCEQIKAQIEEILAQIELAKIQNGLEKPCLHMRFVGSPGTGKTTVARILGKIFKERGVLRIGNLYEYKGRDFCGQYIGETAPKTSGMCRDAYGSVLFIDEAYSLYRGSDNTKDYGVEAIDTLISEMENHKDDLIVIMAGYTDDMERLMESNRGLKSRMPYTIEFPNFTREQLYEIYKSMAASKFRVAEDLYPVAKAYFEGLSDEVLSSKKFSNARFVRNLFERTWAKAAMRCQLDGQKEVVLCAADFVNATAEKYFDFQVEKKIKIGF